MNAFADRPRTEHALAIAATWVAFVAALVIGGDIGDVASFAVVAVIGAALVYLGFAAAARCRVLPQRANAERARLTVLSLAIGIGLGLANLAANMLITASHPAIRTAFGERVDTVDLMQGLVAAPITEEVAVRLFLMSVLAWMAFSLTKRTGLAYGIALYGCAFVFALLHLDRPMPSDPRLADYYRLALMVKYTVASVPLGWIFWRWGLPYAIVCHVAVNAVHLGLQERFF